MVREGLKVLEYFNGKDGLNLSFEEFDLVLSVISGLGTDPDADLKKLETFDLIYLGAVGDPAVKAGVLERGILLKLRFYFDQCESPSSEII